MSQWLVVCSACARHVKSGEQCPFCGAAPTESPAPQQISTRLSRAAMIGLGAAVTLAASHCAPYGLPAGYDSGVVQDSGSTPVDALDQDQGGPAPAYGAVPVDGR